MMQTRSRTKRVASQGKITQPSKAGIPFRNGFQRNYSFSLARVPTPPQPSSSPEAPVAKRYQKGKEANLRLFTSGEGRYASATHLPPTARSLPSRTKP
ncbi:unnamed protein product [Chrysoparadoxa australica]